MRPERWLFALAFTLFALGLTRDAATRWVDATELPMLIHATSTEVRDRNGILLRAYTVEDGLWRMAITPDRVDDRYIDMLIAFEDKRFRHHAGVDPLAMLRATGQAFRHGRIVSGGSTLTMQVARLLEDSGTGALPGKLRQIRVALALERQMSKADILSLYLHLAPFGGNIEGVRAASLSWFGKEPTRLTPAEAALLVALPQSPETRRPDRAHADALAARDRVIDRMIRAQVLTATDAQDAKQDPVPDVRQTMPQLAPHIADRARELGPGRHVTTLDAGLQRRVQRLAREYLTGRDPRLSVAIVLADHQSGEILTSVGSAEYRPGTAQGFVDMTRAVRSPGSTLKPLVYGLAFDRGLAHPETLILDAPVKFGSYAPQNFDGRFRGEVRVRQALQASLNIPVIRLMNRMGPAHLMSALRQSGADPQLPGSAGLATALGGMGLTLEELVQMYAALASGGTTSRLHWQPTNDIVSGARIMSGRAAWQVGHILSGIAPPPTSGPVGNVAYKTGTSYGHRDAWAVGYDGRYVAGVWIGRPDGTPVPGAFGAEMAAPLLFRAMQMARPKAIPLPAPPADALLVSHAQLPKYLKRFGVEVRNQPFQVVFPPEGARLAIADHAIPLKLRGGTPPYILMTDGAIIATDLRQHGLSIPASGIGFTQVSVIDASGRAAHVSVELR